ncbi:MAG: TonB-dependent receptor [Pseudomonadota bacterium]
MDFSAARRAALLTLSLALIAPSGTRAAPSTPPPAEFSFAIPAQPLPRGIEAFSRTTRQQVAADSAAVADLQGRAVSGRMTARAALELLITGTGLELVSVNGRSFALRVAAIEPQRRSAAPGFPIEEVVVTGQQIDRSLFDTKESVAVFTAEEIETRSLLSVQDVFLQTANVTNRPGDLQNFNIRGVPTAPFAAGGGSGALGITYYDDVAITNAASQFISQNLWDVEQVEFLRGPQSTNVGRNALAGALVIRSKLPNPDEFEGAIRIEAGNFDTYAIEGMVNLPLSENSALRLSAERSYTRGFVDNIVTGADDDGQTDFTTIRAKYLIEPTDRISAAVSLQFLDARINFNGFPVPPGSDRDNFETITPEQGDNRYDGLIGSLNLQWELNDRWGLQSITAFSDGDYLVDQPPASITATGTQTIDEALTNFSQELRLSYEGNSTRGVVGLYYLEDKASGPFTFGGIQVFSADVGVPPFVLPFYPEFFLIDQVAQGNLRTENYAIFTQWERDFGDKLTVSLGLRLDRESFDNEFESSTTLDSSTPVPDPAAAGSQAELLQPGLGPVIEGAVAAVNAGLSAFLLPNRTEIAGDFDAVLPEAGITYALTPTMHLSAFYKRGYRAGGAQTLASGDVSDFDPEYIDNFELSLRSRWLDDRLTINANTYYGSWVDQQLAVPIDGNQFNTRTENVGESTIWGFELETSFAPSERTELFASLGYNDTNFDDFCSVSLTEPSLPDCEIGGATGKDLSGNQFAFAAPWSFSLGGKHMISNRWYIQANATYQDESFSDIENLERNAGEDLLLINASAGYLSKSFEARVYVTNLFNEFYEIGRSVNNVTGFDQVQPNAPRQYGVVLSKSF